ncbi:tripartite tricarboxylate transporter substrate binding protein [Variovorax sp. Sphag1AA]|uniref:Bug family tripartite tricarboxylate transporter substrate binding protein n=1 Tax=Variovorax sp. Sphag1AA TaxID=2587027 RepID=UPI001612850F|nr:tripartite tricarboxylate transporter substrate binding protein [Variovorax sp. Sphag1AA]MBB3182110.1 tripartite-type tricarboxylate transporter receptor subunit TctC [Variovorax sp. Sphag1AA]
MQKHFTRARRAVLAAALTLGAVLPAAAQNAPFPNKPIRIVIPTAPGGNMDALARLYAAKLTEAWGQQVIVEPKPGANTILATSYVAKSPADGYTALFTISGFIQNLVLQSNPQYKMSDLAPVSLVASFPIALAANAALPANDLAAVIRLAKQDPEKYTFGSYGVGSGAHLIGEGLNKAAGIRIKHAAYKGEAASFTDVASGEIALAYGSVGFYANQITSGKVKLIAVASPNRLKTFPDLPTFAELGYPDINLPGWGAMFLPAGTPAPIVEKYVQEIRRITALPDVQAKIYQLGYEPVANTNTEFAQFLQEDLKRWTRIARENDIRLD